MSKLEGSGREQRRICKTNERFKFSNLNDLRTISICIKFGRNIVGSISKYYLSALLNWK